MVLNLNKCTYCDKEFTRERTLQVHLCEPKRRHLQKNEKWVQNAFIVFQRFYEIHQKGTKEKTPAQKARSDKQYVEMKTDIQNLHFAFFETKAIGFPAESD